MHTVESCCGQFGKRETNPNFVSGYVCRDCWSTKAETDCPCGLGKRTEKPGTAHSSGAKHPLHQAATVSTEKLKLRCLTLKLTKIVHSFFMSRVNAEPPI